MKKLLSVLGVVAAVLVIVFVVMGSSSDSKQSAENEIGDMASSQQSSDNSANKDISEKAENVIEIKNFKFVPEKMTIKKGTIITWKNFDNTKHNVIFDDESAGEVDFPYHCMPHPYMKGSVTVTQ